MADKQQDCSNVQVAVRCRPINSREKAAGNLHVVMTEPAHNRIRVAHKKLDRTYQYDHVFGPFASQEEVFTSTVEPIVREMLQGYSTTVFAYGQTGTGKTHTMEGDITDKDQMGVIPRSVHAIFEYLEGIKADYTVRTSFLELYNEELQDLLADSSLKSKVVLREDTKRGVVCCGLEEVQVLTAKDIFAILSRGIQQRKTAETLMNKNSSRSHSIFTLKIMIKECMPDGQEVMRNGQLNLVDLAGSECVGRSGAKNVRAREAGNINQSLLTLGRVITALVEHHPHVPYRDSKLTRLLQESLGGRAKTCIIATVTSSSDALEETLSSLDYALKAKSIQNKPVANQKLSKTHLLKEYAGEVESLRSMLQASRDKNGVYIEPWRFEQMENRLESQSNQMTEMEGILTSRNSEAKELKAERDSFQEKAMELEEALEVSRANEEATSAKLAQTQERLKGVEEDLATSRAESEELRKQLATTENTLMTTQQELAATRAVVVEQASTEAKLRSEAAQTKRSLTLAESDVESLCAKVARQDDEAMRKRSGAQEFGMNASMAVKEVSGAVAIFAGVHEKGCEGLRQGLVDAEQAARSAAQDLSAAAVVALEEVNRHCKELSKGVFNGGASAKELVSHASTGLEKALSLQRSAVQEWEAQMVDSLGELRQGLEGHENELNSLTEDVKRRSDEAEREMANFKDKCAIELTGVRRWAEETMAAQAKQMEQKNETALALAAESRENAMEEAAQLMQTVSGLLSAMEKKASVRAEKQADASRAAWTESISAAKSFGVAVSEKMDVVEASVASGSEHMLHKLSQSSSATNITIQGQAEAAVSFADCAVELAGSVSDGAARSAALGDAASSSLKENLAAVSEVVDLTVDACDKSAEALVQKNAQAAQSVAALATAAENSANERMVETENEVSGLAEAVGEMVTSHISSIGRCEQQMKEHVEEACTTRGSSGGTPERQRYPRPEKFSSTRAHSDIMCDFRAGKTAGAPFDTLSSNVPLQHEIATFADFNDENQEDDGEGGRSGDSSVVGTDTATSLEDDSGDAAEGTSTLNVDGAAVVERAERDNVGHTVECVEGEENVSISGSPKKTAGSVFGELTEDHEGGESPLGETTNTSAAVSSKGSLGSGIFRASKIPTARRSTRIRHNAM